MKRVIYGFLLGLLSVLLLSGCAKNKDPYAAYRNQSAATIFEKGQVAFKKKHYADAAKYYDALNTVYPFSPYSKEARLNIITAYYYDDNSESSLEAADEYIRLYPQAKNVDYAYYMKGLTSYRGGLNWLQKKAHASLADRDTEHLQVAYNIFQILIRDYPHSRYRNPARKYMKDIRNLLALHEITVGKFYIKKKAYLAAINRANVVLKDFPDTPSVPDALAIRVTAYQKLNMPQLAQSSLKRLQAQYPGSEQLRSVT
jgi:outer membrane protein assembly factor BamD